MQSPLYDKMQEATHTMKSRWLSPPIDEINGRKVFRDCQINSGERISTGDFVHLLPEDPSMELYIGRIESMYEDEKALKCIHIRWFYRPQDLQHDPPLQPLENEVYHTSYYDCQLVESVVGRCKIIQRENYLKMKARSISFQTTEQADIYACGYSYSSEAGVFATIQAEDLAEGHAENPTYLDTNENGTGEISHEDAAVAKEHANALLSIDRRVPREVTSADWSTAKRLPWVLQAKNAMTLEDLKQLLIELESGLVVFKDQSGWRKSVHAIASFDTLGNHIQYLKHNAQQKVDDAFKRPRKMNPPSSQMQLDEQTKKRKAFSAQLEPPKRQAIEDGGQSAMEGTLKKINAGSAYEIDHTHLPPDAPTDLKSLRVVLVVHSTKDNVIIKFPSISSLTKYISRSLNSSHAAVDQQKPATRSCSFVEPHTAIGTKPILDGQFVLPQCLVERVLKRLISCTEYLHQGHLESFWLCSNLHVKGHESESRDMSGQAKLFTSKTALSNGLQQTMPSPASLKASVTKTESPESPYYTHKKFGRTRVQGSVLRKCKDEMQKHSKFFAADQNFPQDLYPGSLLGVEKKLTPESHHTSDGYNASVRWGARKKIIYQQRSQANSPSGNDSGYREHTSEDSEVHSQGRAHLRLNFNGQFTTTVDGRGKISILRVPKDMQGRWSSERYKAAQLKLLRIMHEKGAVPGKPILRPALREEARKHIGDTGLLDHLLKHMTDTVVSNGERFRRRHNSEGAMEYWLEDASLVDIRRQAGVEDPCWIPPPGWKPGDAIPKNSFYGFVTQMSPSQAEEMKQLKEDVVKLKSQMHSLSVRMKGSLTESRGNALPAVNDIYQSWGRFEEDIRNQTQEIKQELSQLTEALREGQPYCGRVNENLATGSEPHRQDELEEPGNDSDMGKARLTHCDIKDHLERIHDNITKLAEDATSRYRSLSNEKKLVDEQLDDLWKSVEVMQEDVSVVLNSMGFSQDVPLLLPCEPVSNGFLALTDKAMEELGPRIQDPLETDMVAPSFERDTGSASKDNIFLFQRAAQASSQILSHHTTSELPRSKPVLINTVAMPCPSAEKHNILPGEEHDRCGFRVWKPEGSYLWPRAGKFLSPASDTNEQVNEMASSIQASQNAITSKGKVLDSPDTPRAMASTRLSGNRSDCNSRALQDREHGRITALSQAMENQLHSESECHLHETAAIEETSSQNIKSSYDFKPDDANVVQRSEEDLPVEVYDLNLPGNPNEHEVDEAKPLQGFNSLHPSMIPSSSSSSSVDLCTTTVQKPLVPAPSIQNHGTEGLQTAELQQQLLRNHHHYQATAMEESPAYSYAQEGAAIGKVQQACPRAGSGLGLGAGFSWRADGGLMVSPAEDGLRFFPWRTEASATDMAVGLMRASDHS